MTPEPDIIDFFAPAPISNCVRVPEKLETAETGLLLQAFEMFTQASSSLESAFGQLQARAQRLTEELEAKNAELEKSLREKEEAQRYLRTILERLPCGVFVLDGNGTVTLCNPMASEVLDQSQCISSGDRSEQYLTSEIRNSLTASGAAEGCKGEMEIPFVNGDKKRVISTSWTPLSDASGTKIGTLHIIRDITEVKTLQEQSKRIERLSAMGEMAAELAHEIRNPLGSIELFSSLLARDLSGDLKRWAESIRVGIRSLNTIVSNMLHFANPLSPALASVNVHEIIEEIVRFSDPVRNQREVQVETQLNAEDPAILGDAELLKQMMLNLIFNAMKAMPAQGSLIISTRNIRRRKEKRRLHCLELKIRDTGIGIPPENLKRIFDPFFTTNRNGTGLGLSVVHQIVEKHSGSIRVSSKVNQGTAFTIVFGSRPERVQRMEEELLIVDDEPQMLIAINETLRRNGYSITTAGSGMEAMRKLKEKYYQLVITDMRMPEVSGLDLLRKVKNLTPQTPVVLLTAYGTVQNAVEAMRDGAFDYLMKPFSSEALETVVRRALDSVARKNERVSHELITQDPGFSRTLEQASQAAASTATVLIEAESGTGKELLARRIHHKSPRNSGPFVAVNCAALPENLLESELFGFEKGSFTGASVSKPGKFELANRGTLLLDEIGEMAPILQAKLLRVLQEKEIDRIGGKDPVDIDVRVIATTNRDLLTLVRNEGFREDLYYRLNVVRLTIPPLRDRRADIPLLADFFCKRYGRNFGRDGIRLSNEAIDRLLRHDWPGNVRELENMIQRAVTLCTGSTIKMEDLHLSESPLPQLTLQAETKPSELGYSAGVTMREMERQLICRTLQDTQGNRTRAAKCLGISLRTLRNKLNEFGLQDRQAKSAHSHASC